MEGDRQGIASGIAAVAVTLAEMGCDEQTARAKIIEALQQVGADDVEILDEAAAAIGAGPQYRIGASGAPESLNAQLQAREWLVSLAAALRDAM